MTSIDKLSKSFDFLKIPVQLYDPEQRKHDVKQIAKKDKITHLNLIYENIISTNVRQADEYSKMVSLSIEAFLVYYDDGDQDVYFVADECLNKTIKALLDTNLIRLQYDLYRFIRKNGPERSLKGALIRFAELSHLIKSHKCRMFVEFLIKENTLSKIASRHEESIQNVLVISMTKICSSFCWSMTDNEIKMLIQSFLPNLSNESSVNSYRRVAAICLSTICLYSRSPYSFYNYLLEELSKLILPLESCKNIFKIWGTLICFRFMVIHLAELDKSSASCSNSLGSSLSTSSSFSPSSTIPASPSHSSTRSSSFYSTQQNTFNKQNTPTKSFMQNFNLSNLCEIYEICVYFLNSDDNRIVTSSLECLQVLFKSLPFKFNLFLTSIGSMSNSFIINRQLAILNYKEQQQLQNRTNENTKTTSIQLSSSKVISASPSSFLDKPSVNLSDLKVSLNTSGFELSTSEDFKMNETISSSLSSSMDSLNTLKLSSQHQQIHSDYSSTVSSDKVEGSSAEVKLIRTSNENNTRNEAKSIILTSESKETDLDEKFAQIKLEQETPNNFATIESKYPVKSPNKMIGKFYEQKRAPIDYFVRLLCYKYLLNINYDSSGEDDSSQTLNMNKLKSDSQVKVLVKAIALDCCSNAIALCPHLLFYSLYDNGAPSLKLVSRENSIEDAGTGADENEDLDMSSESKNNFYITSANAAGESTNDQIKNGFNLFIYDLISYVNHVDDKMRMNIFTLIGQFINNVLIEFDGDYDVWLNKMISIYFKSTKKNETKNSIDSNRAFNSLQLQVLIDYLIHFIKLDNQKLTNNMCKRYALNSLHACLPALIQTKYCSYSLEILINLLHLRHSTYNLVKCELVDLISSIDFRMVNYVEQLLPGDAILISLNKTSSDLGGIVDVNDTLEDDLLISPNDSANSKEKNVKLNYSNSNASQKSTRKSYVSNTNGATPFLVRKTQERIIEDVFLYLLGSDDSKLRLEAARSLTRFILNMSFYDVSLASNQNSLLSAGEYLIKTGGYASNIFSPSIIDKDTFNLNSISYLFENGSSLNTKSSQRSSSIYSATNILFPQRHIRYSCSPLSSVSLLSSLAWLSKSNNILNNNFIQPFHSLIKYWPSTASFSNSINPCLDKVVEHNLNYIVPIILKTLLQSIDKYQFIGCLETLDYIFQTYTPAIYYSSSISSNVSNQSSYLFSSGAQNLTSQNYSQIFDLLNLMINYLKHPLVAFDLYVNDIVMRLIGSLYCSYAWLSMKKLDKLVQQLNYNINTNNPSSNPSLIQFLIDSLNNAIKNVPYQPSQAEYVTGLSYSYPLAFNNNSLKGCIDQLFVHVMRMLCVLACVIDENALPSVLTSNLSAGSTAVTAQVPPPPTLTPASSVSTTNINNATASNPNVAITTVLSQPSSSTSSASSSPTLKAKLNQVVDQKSSKSTFLSLKDPISSKVKATIPTTIPTTQINSTSNQSTTNSTNTGTGGTNSSTPGSTSSTSSLPKTSTNIYLGYFQNSSNYLKLYETVKVGYNSYKKSPNVGTYDRFCQLVKTTLKLFAQLLESGLGVHEIGPHLDEILLYLRVIFSIDPSCSVKCVTLTLKSLFFLNLSGLMFDFVQQQLNPALNVNSPSGTPNATTPSSVQTPSFSNQSGANSQYGSNVDLISSAAAASAGGNALQISSVPLSGLSSVLSTSMTSIASYSQSTGFNTNQIAATLAGSSARHQTSLLSTIVTNQLNQFTRFMNSQTASFKSDSLTSIQINQTNQLLNVPIGFDSIDYMQTSTSSSNTISASSTSVLSNPSNPKPQSDSALFTQSTLSNVSTVSKTTPFNTNPFSLFGLIRKSKTETPASQQQQQQQQQKELQQQKLKQQKTDHKTITQYIKSFESIVIKSLRQYTFTTSVNLQTRILELLSQLIFLKVDYCLLDSDKVFIEYVLKQFDYLEQKRTSDGSMGRIGRGGVSNSNSSQSLNSFDLNVDETGANLLAKSYSIDLYENFDSESSISDPLNPFDLDTMLNKLCSTLNSSQSSSLGAGGSSSTFRFGNTSASSGIGSSTISFSSYGSVSTSPITSNLSLKQQEHQRNHILIPKLFDFLILLSHEKKHSTQPKTTQTQQQPVRSSYKSGNGLITVPEVMQLCDNLIASENSPHTHAIPALRPLVIDLFLNRTNEDSKELDMQHDVIMMSMLRLIQYPQVWPLLTIAVLKYKKDNNEEKWKKVSRQICDSLFDSMRSSFPNYKLRFKEFNGNELRAIRRYSRSYVPWIESLKVLLKLLNCLAPQVFRPIDFILLSLFEISKSSILTRRQLSTNQINNWLCILIVHIYLLLSHSTEDQILIRLHNLMPEILTSYKNKDSDNSVNYRKRFRSTSSYGSSSTTTATTRSASTSPSSSDLEQNNPADSSNTSDEENSVKSNEKNENSNSDQQSHTTSSRIDKDEIESTYSASNTSSSNSHSTKLKQNRNSSKINNIYYESGLFGEGLTDLGDENELDMTDSALFLAKFLLRVLEKVFSHLNSLLKFNSSMYFSTNLSASTSSSLLRDFQINSFRDINHTQHLLSNYLLFVMFIVNSLNFPKLSSAISSLINNRVPNKMSKTKASGKSKEKYSSFKKSEKESNTKSSSKHKKKKSSKTSSKKDNQYHHDEYEANESSQHTEATNKKESTSEDFFFDHSQFSFKINRIILFKFSKTNPFLASMWQYFLILCNYQDTEYWSSSIETNNRLNSELSSPIELDKVESTTINDFASVENVGANLNDQENCSSNSSTNNNSLNPSYQQQSTSTNRSDELLIQQNQLHTTNKGLKSKIKSKLYYSSKHNDGLRSYNLNYNKKHEYQFILPSSHIHHSTLNEQLFRFLSITVYCEYISTRNQLDNTTGLTMLLINNLVELFELASHEPTVLDIFSTIHRNASASSLFIHCINSNWSTIISKRKLYLFHSCLKSLEGVHLCASGHLLNLLIDKYFHLPYLSLVRYADHIACQRVEMMHSLSPNELFHQLTEQDMKNLNKFFSDFKYSYRHQRLILLLDQLQSLLNESNSSNESTATTETGNATLNPLSIDTNQNQREAGLAELEEPIGHNEAIVIDPSLNTPVLNHQIQPSRSIYNLKTSPSIDFFMLYLNTSSASALTRSPSTFSAFANLDKEWYYNIVRSACCYSSNSGQNQAKPNNNPIDMNISIGMDGLLLNDNSSLKSKQCALMLSNLDYSNAISILAAKDFKLSILKDCLLLGAKRTELAIQKLPTALKQAAANNNLNFDKDFMHPLWLSSTNLLFDLLNDLCLSLPKPPLITFNNIANHSHLSSSVPIGANSSNSSLSNSSNSIYESKLNELSQQYDYYSYISPITEAINAYLKCVRQYPSLQHQLIVKTDENNLEENFRLLQSSLSDQETRSSNCSKLTSNAEKINDLITYIIFQLGFVNFISIKKRRILTMHSLSESLLCLFNLLIDSKLLNAFCERTKRTNYSTLVACIIKDFYQLLIYYFFKTGDENLIHTPNLSPKYNIDYTSGQNYTNDVLFNTTTFDTLLKLRFLITNHRWSGSLSSSGDTSSDSNSSATSSSMSSSFSVSSTTHRFLQNQSHFFRDKIPLNMRDLVEKIYLSLCRLPVIDRFIRIPDSLWRMPGFKLDYAQFLKSDSSDLPPLDYLRDPQILKEHLKHILCVGWTSRTQFEYEYVNMLTLLHNLSDDYYPPGSSSNATMNSSTDESQQQSRMGSSLPIEEVKERNKCICLVVKGLSSWLIKSTLTPKSGCSLNSLYEQVSRNKVPPFLHTQLGRQYSQVKRIIESYSRNTLFTRLNAVSISNNINLLHMLDPTLIDEIDRNKRKAAASLASPINQTSYLRNVGVNSSPRLNRPLDFTQPQPTVDALANLVQISMSLSQRDHNLLFSTNIERTMVVNLPTNTDSYFYFTQISLEGLLKFLGLWNKNNTNKQQQTTAASIAASFSNFVSGNSSSLVAGTTAANVVDEVSAKTANAINSLIKVAEFFTEDTDLIGRSSISSTSISSNLNQNDQFNASIVDETTGNNLPLLLGSGQTNLEYQDQTNYIMQMVQRSFNRNNLDLTSVLRTVLDYYESFFKHPCLQLKLEIFKSMIYLANNLFDSKQQYESLVNKLQNNFDWLTSFIQQDYDDQSSMLMPVVNELIDESILAIAIYAESLCRCCLHTSKNDFTISMSNKDFERINKLFENGFRSNSLSIKIATVQGLIYWLESITLGYLSNNNDAKQLTDHLCKQINLLKDINYYATANPRYISTLWSAVFYAIENCLDSIRDAQNFVSLFIKQTYTILNDPNTPYFLFYQLYMGLERCLLSSMIPSFEISSIQRLLTSKFYDEQRSLCLTSLTVTSMYACNQSKQVNYWHDIVQQQQTQQQTGLSNSFSMNNLNNSTLNSPSVSELNSPTNEHPLMENPNQTNRTSGVVTTTFSNAEKAQMSGYPQILELSAYPELQSHLLKVLEVVTSFLDKMKSSPTAREASVYASLLPKMLCDFLPPHDLLNKLITEFLNSSQHPYPEAVAYVLHKSFDLLQEKGLQSQIQEWCLLSLCNFLQRTSIYESIWLTSCLLVSATRNQWLKSTFPFLLNRYCSFETIDRAIFYMSVIEFRKQFQDKSQLQTIYSTFEAVAKPGTPYAELIKLLNYQNEE